MRFESEPDAEPTADGLAHLFQIDLNLLAPLRVLLEERSVTRAAQRVGLSQPAMSHTLNRCRRLLRDELLTRVGTTLELTPRARGLIEPLSRILRLVDREVLEHPGFVPSVSTRRFRVAAESSTALVVLPPLIRELAESAPGVSIQAMPPLLSGEDLLDRPEVDLLLLADTLRSAAPRERLYVDRWVAVVAPDNPSVTGELTSEHLSTIPHVLFDIQGTYVPPYTVMDALGIGYTVQARAHDFLLIPLLLAGTRLMAIVQQRVARHLSAAGLVRVHSLPIDVPPLGIDMIWNPRLSHDPALPWLRQHLVEAVTRFVR